MLKDTLIPRIGDIVTNKSSVAIFRVIEICDSYVRARKVFSLSKKKGGVYRVSKRGLRELSASDLREMWSTLGALAAGEMNREAK